MLLGKRESSEEAFTQFKSFNLTACGVMMSCEEGRGGPAAHIECVTNDWAGLRMVCGCQDFLNQMSGSQIVSQVDVVKTASS